MFASSESRWASLSPQVPREGSKPSLLWPPRSVPQSCRMRGNRTQHLHRLQVASVASGIVAIRSIGKFHADICGPNCLVNSVWYLVQTNTFLHAVRGKAKHLLHVAVVKHGANESYTEPRLHLRLAEPLASASSILLWLLFVEKSSPGIASRSLVGHPVKPQVVLLHPIYRRFACWGLFLEEKAYSSIVFGRSAVGCADKINF